MVHILQLYKLAHHLEISRSSWTLDRVIFGSGVRIVNWVNNSLAKTRKGTKNTKAEVKTEVRLEVHAKMEVQPGMDV